MKSALLLFQLTLLLFSCPAVLARIVGGTLADDNEYPSYVHTIQEGVCGGTLIYKDIVLTAAHCAPVFPVGTTVYIGANDVFGTDGETNVVAKGLPHPGFDKNGMLEDDIMLLKLQSASSSPVVALNEDATIPPTSSKVDVIGFGTTSEGGVLSYDLLEVELTVQDFQTCSANLDAVQYEDTQLCAGETEGGKDSCQGDSGGPLFVAGSNVQVGIVSYGFGCARPGLPGVNTKVSAYIDFIKDGICQLSSDPPAECPPKENQEGDDKGCSRFVCCGLFN